jgi:hypothetical protein
MCIPVGKVVGIRGGVDDAHDVGPAIEEIIVGVRASGFRCGRLR